MYLRLSYYTDFKYLYLLKNIFKTLISMNVPLFLLILLALTSTFSNISIATPVYFFC